MNASSETTKTENMSLAGTVGGLARHYLGGRRGLIGLGIAIVVAGMALNWSWFVAIGLAPLILAVAPCLAMRAGTVHEQNDARQIVLERIGFRHSGRENESAIRRELGAPRYGTEGG